MRALSRICAVLLLPALASSQMTTSICEIQEYDSEGLSPLVGYHADVVGVVTAPTGIFFPACTSFYIESGGCGVNVFGFDPGISVDLGDTVRVTGTVTEYISSSTGGGAVTQISLWSVDVISTGSAEPLPTDMSIASLQVEQNEGRFMRTIGTVVSTSLPWAVDISDGGDPLTIYGAGAQLDLSGFEIGDEMRVTGVLSQYDRTAPYFDDYEFMPRYQSDIEEWTASPVTETSWGCIKALYGQ